jgi:hypothetical protein
MLALLRSSEKQCGKDCVIFRSYIYTYTHLCWTSWSSRFYKNYRMFWKLPLFLSKGRIQQFCEICGVAEVF